MQLSISQRPRKISSIFGQPTLVKELEKRQLEHNWPQALLLKGPSGTGKTSVAQIIAMSINCPSVRSGLTGDPCCKCPSCLSIINETFDRDTYRLDGSQSGKDDVIEIASLVNISPMYDPNTIIIIEESDQLSTKAKMALLKVLEKPQTNIYFILLSMTNTGIPTEIQSRCQTYNFKSFNSMDIMYALKDILIKENIWDDESIPSTFKINGLRTIAEASGGSLRAAIQYLERSLIGEYFTVELIRNNLGIIEDSKAKDMIRLLINNDYQFFEEFDEMDYREFIDSSYSTLIKLIRIVPLNSKRHYDLLAVYDDFSIQPILKRNYVISKFLQFMDPVDRIGKKVSRRFDEE